MMRHRWTVRLRLTALHGGLVLLAGTALLAITYVLLAQVLNRLPISSATLATLYDVRPAGVPGVPAVNLDDVGQTVKYQQAAQLLQSDLRSATLASLLRYGGLTLLLVSAAGIWLAWLAAGRSLRPLTEITATARRVAGRNLHERIGLTGPPDELRRLADTFDDMLARLDEAFAAQRRFTANASHELRTPLAIDRTLIEVALSRPDAGPDLHRLGRSLLANNARHERLIEGLLLLARSEQQLTGTVPADLGTITGHVVESARARAEQAGVTLTVDAGPAPLTGDPVLLERLVHNLVDNAIAYNVEAGRVEVTCRPGRLTVVNTGPEIGAEEAAGLFEPFRRLTDRVGSATGTGLGLSIVRAIAQAHGGTVTAFARTGGGLRVSVEWV